MGEVLIAVLGVVVLVHLAKSMPPASATGVPASSTAPGNVPIYTPPPPVPTAPSVAPATYPVPKLGGAYTVVPAATSLAAGQKVVQTRNGVATTFTVAGNGGILTGFRVTKPQTPTVQPPPSVSGGISGTVGSGGIPLGGSIVPGVSYGTGTTRIPVVY